MMGEEYVFQISGIRDVQMKGKLLQGIRQLKGNYIGGSIYNEKMTHLIVMSPTDSEKFTAACAGGKWIVTPDYVTDSMKHQAWLPEASYELNITSNPNSLGTNPLKNWREKVTRGEVSGAFQGWVVHLEIEDPKTRSMFQRILEAGNAVVWVGNSPIHAVTLVLTKGRIKLPKNLVAPSYDVSYIAKHLFGSLCSDLNVILEKPLLECAKQTERMDQNSLEIKKEPPDVCENLFPLDLEQTFKNHIAEMELQKKCLQKVPQLFSCDMPVILTQAKVDFSNVRSLLECCLFPQALEEVKNYLVPGVLPPAQVMQMCMQHALNGEGEPYFLSLLSTILNDILCINPTWSYPESVKYFLQILQCPQCKNGVLPLLQASVRFCLADTATCHSMPSPAPPELLRFHSDLQAFFLRLFKGELYAANLCTAEGGHKASVLSTAFWSVWEKSTLNSRALRQLVELLVETVRRAPLSTQNCKLLVTLQEMLAVVVEYWVQGNKKLNGRLVEKGFQDLTEHLAILCQDLPPDCLKELLPGLPSPRLKLNFADAMYRNFCSRIGLNFEQEPLSLHKIVSSYMKALGRLCGHNPKQGAKPQTDRIPSAPLNSQVENAEASERAGGSGLGKENIPRGFNRVNAAGETLLHRACKRNRVEMVRSFISVPGTDANVKDNAGWTPLHEACNYGSTESVELLLKHCPGLQLDSRVSGVTPLHDALTNQHIDIAKLLLSHGGSKLLHLRDNFRRTPLDLVGSPALREELLRIARESDSALETRSSEVQDLAFIEASSCLLSCLLLSYLVERNIPTYDSSQPYLGLTPPLAQALVEVAPGTLASRWKDAAAIALVEDLRTVMSMERYVRDVSPALRRCSGPQTGLLLKLLEDLRAEGTALLHGNLQL